MGPLPPTRTITYSSWVSYTYRQGISHVSCQFTHRNSYDCSAGAAGMAVGVTGRQQKGRADCGADCRGVGGDGKYGRQQYRGSRSSRSGGRVSVGWSMQGGGPPVQYNVVMQAIITRVQASKFSPNQPRPKPKLITLTHQHLLLGRQPCPQPPQHTQPLPLPSLYISKHHALLSLPYTLSACHHQLLSSTMQYINGALLPTYYLKFRGGWQAVPAGLLGRVRQYAGVREAVVVRDLGSTAGTYVRVRRVVMGAGRTDLLHQGTYPNNIVVAGHQVTLELGATCLLKVTQLRTCLTLHQLDHAVKQLVSADPSQHVLRLAAPHPHPHTPFTLLQLHHHSLHKSIKTYLLAIPGSPSCRAYVGRSPHCDIQINVSEMSRRQLGVWVGEDGSTVLEDCGTTNGTWLRVQRLALGIGDLAVAEQGRSTGGEGVEGGQSGEQSAGEQDEEEEQVWEVMERKQDMSDRLRPLELKLGECKLTIELRNVAQARRQMEELVRNKNVEVGMILTEISGILQKSELEAQMAGNPETRTREQDFSQGSEQSQMFSLISLI